jgi:hypothetical protein
MNFTFATAPKQTPKSKKESVPEESILKKLTHHPLFAKLTEGHEDDTIKQTSCHLSRKLVYDGYHGTLFVLDSKSQLSAINLNRLKSASDLEETTQVISHGKAIYECNSNRQFHVCLHCVPQD